MALDKKQKLETDLERIQFIEQIFGFGLKQVEPDKISQKDFYTVSITGYYLSTLQSPSFPFKGARSYCINEHGNVTGLALDFSPAFLLPAGFLANFKSLDFLSLRSSAISNVSFLKELKGLTSLSLRNTQIKDVSFLKELKGLTSLDLSSNQIKEIPSWLTEKGLEITIERFATGINLYNNPIEQPPIEVVQRGNAAIRDYYEQIESQGQDFLYEAKMLIVGEGESGKTTLAHKIEDADCKLPHIDDRTKGITIKPHTFAAKINTGGDEQQFHLNVWDFGGQEIYHATHRFFLSKRSLYVLVADNRKDDTDFNYWLNIIETFAGDSPMIIVLNEKGDVQRGVNRSELLSRFPESIKGIVPVNFKTREETDKAKRKQRLKVIKQLVSDIEHCAESLPHIGEPVPAHWIDVRQAIETDSRNYIFRAQFDDMCRSHEITDKGHIDTLLGYLHDLGIVLHFSDNPLLRDRVILRPAWATSAVYRILDNDTIKSKGGRFTRDDCDDLWSDEQYDDMHDVLIELMKNFRLIYEIGSTGNLVAPQMLPENTPDYSWDPTDNSLMQFRYDRSMPSGMLWQFIVMMYRYIKNHDWVWRNGVTLQRDGTPR